MGGDIQQLDRRAAKAMLQWWLESGVDVPIAEEPRRWLASPAVPTTTPAAPEPPVAAPPQAMPDQLDAFRGWLETGSGLPLDRPGASRVLPQGVEGAEIMILADMPASDDQGNPLGGESWALAVRMLAAIGLTPDQAYVASIACFAAPGARLDAADLERCADIARHHVALVKPRRLLLFGDGPARALTGQPVIRARDKVHKVAGVRAVATFHPRHLRTRPEHKALAWRDLLLLMEDDT